MIYYLAALATLSVLLATPARAQFTNGQPADLVLLQPNFTTTQNGTSARRAFTPAGIAIDPTTGKLFVADNGNSRILRFGNVAALATNAGAEAVIGQTNFADSGVGTTQEKFSSPNGITVDRLGRLWVADTDNNRVLMWEAASFRATGASADAVFGQSSFTTAVASTAANGLDRPFAVAVDSADQLWVVDTGNNRVLRFNNISSQLNGSPANGVLGQPGFLTSTPGTTAATLSDPNDLAIDATGRVWIADGSNNRVLRFDAAALKPNGGPADGVLGQPDFTTATFPGAPTASNFNFPAGLALSPTGALWVSDLFHGRAVGFDNATSLPDGSAATSVLGQLGFSAVEIAYTAVGPILATGLTFDTAGRLWTSNNGGHRVLRFTPPPPAAAIADTSSPTIKVRGRKSIDSTRNRIVLRGTAADDTAVAGIEYKVSGQRGLQSAKGTTRWKAVIRPDKNKRKTVVRVRATDPAGNRSRFLKVKIFRR
ncbi:MAG: NHL repeat-containing protein [Chthoniobacterales bacterium]